MPVCSRYIWEISQSAFIPIKILATHWQFVGYNQNFDFCPICQSNLFLVTQFVLAIWEILPLATVLCSNLREVCVSKWGISTISLTVWHVGYQSHGILGNFDTFPTKSVIS